uniref:CHAT domain-containing protein n=1 Tax=Bionectria ochroleuca TaxID=29856 RepID=A0A0B7JTD4_BIOOC
MTEVIDEWIIDPGQSRAGLEDNPDLPTYLDSLSTFLEQRFLQLRDEADLEEAVQLGREVLQLAPINHPKLGSFMRNLSRCLGHQYNASYSLPIIDEAVQLGRQAILQIENAEDKSRSQENLATRLYERFLHQETIDDIDEAIRNLKTIFHDLHYNNSVREHCQDKLGTYLEVRYSKLEHIEDLDEAIQFGRLLVQETFKFNPLLPKYCWTLSDRLMKRCKVEFRKEHVLEVVELVKQARKQESINEAGALNNLAVKLSVEYTKTGDLQHLDQAINIGQQIMQTVPEDHSTFAVGSFNLSNNFFRRYLKLRAKADLEGAINFGIKSLQATPSDSLKKHERWNAIGTYLEHRYIREGDIADLDQAIKIGNLIAQETKDNVAYQDEYRRYLNNLGLRYQKRFLWSSSRHDLEEAISCGKQAVLGTIDHHPDIALFYHNLSMALDIKYAEFKALWDLEEAILWGRTSISQAYPDNNPEIARYKSHLGMLLEKLYTVSNNVQDRKDAIECYDSALQQVNGVTQYRIEAGTKLLRCHGTMEDWEQAFEAAQLAAAGLGCDAAALGLKTGRDGLAALLLLEQGRCVLSESIQDIRTNLNDLRGKHPQKAEDFIRVRSELEDPMIEVMSILESSDQSFVQAQVIQTESHRRFEIIRRLGRLQDEIQSIDSFENFGKTVELTGLEDLKCKYPEKEEEFMRLYDELQDSRGELVLELNNRSFSRPDHIYRRHRLIWDLGKLIADVQAIPGFEDFMEVSGSTGLQELRLKYSEKAEDFVRLRSDLENCLTHGAFDSESKNQLSAQARANHRYGTVRKLDDLVADIRAMPGLENFMTAPDRTEICAAANSGPIVVINASSYRCDAILIQENEIKTIPLPDLILEEAKRRSRRDQIDSPSTLKWLWHTVTGPILDALGFSHSPVQSDWPHVWWIPTGIVTKLPLHASGLHYQGSTETVLDRVVSSYSTSIRCMIYARQQDFTPPRASSKALLIGVENTPEHSHLKFAKQEVNTLERIFKEMSLDVLNQLTCKKDVELLLPDCKLFHFAGHGHADLKDPLQSYLLLQDWKTDRLTVASLLEMNLSNNPPFLGYLSACGTGRSGDDEFIDENLHLISAYQLAGFRHVIGTLWEVNDEQCVHVARRTYEVIRDKGMTDESVSLGLHEACRDLRDQWLSERASKQIRMRSKENKQISPDEEKGEYLAFSHKSESIGPSARDAIPDSSDDENVSRRPVHWIPYVHFGL